MKRIIAFSALAVMCAAPALAVEFNTDALKSMQEEGHKIVAESGSARSYKASNGQCLEAKGSGLVIANCNGKNNNQKWTMDGNQRLVAHDGRCVGGAQLQKCGGSNAQKWTLDGSKRLASKDKKCLQPQGSPPKAGAKVIAASCSKSAHQVWK
jgi:Ricin-type beta-trefoil lectin domain